jgi:hypothetical protein
VTPSGPIAVNLPANGGTQEVTITFSGCPTSVAVGGLLIKYNLPLTDGETWANNGTNGNFEGWERACFLNAAPVGLMQTLWADMAEYSCRWAFGAVSDWPVRQEMTRGMHSSSRSEFAKNSYNPTETGRVYWLNPNEPLDLKGYLNDLGNPWVGSLFPRVADMDCRSFASILKVALNAQGIVARCDLVARPGNPTPEFYYWPLCRAMRNPLNDTNYSDFDYYDSGAFYFHVIVTCDVSSVSGQTDERRYDSAASYKFNLSGQFYRQVVYDWPIASFWQNAGFRGLAYSATTKSQLPWSLNEPVPHGEAYFWEPASVN